MDVIPGRDNCFELTPTARATFAGKCAELCGAYHSRMLFNVKVVSAGGLRRPPQDLAAQGNTGPRWPLLGGPDASTQAGSSPATATEDDQ